MKEITEISGHNFNLYVSPNGYGFNFHGRWTGMVGQLLKKRADIAVADLTITNERKNVIDFTVPFFASGISALILKSHRDRFKSWKDLSNQTDIAFGILENGPTRRIFQSSNDPIIEKMWKTISSNSSNFVISYTDAIRRITTGKYIFIGESSHNEYISGHRCDLTYIDSGLPHDRTYGIALHKDSPLLQDFNFAINLMKITGKIAELRRKWWRSQCK